MWNTGKPLWAQQYILKAFSCWNYWEPMLSVSSYLYTNKICCHEETESGVLCGFCCFIQTCSHWEPYFHSNLNMTKKKKFQKFFEYHEENSCLGQEEQHCLYCQVHRSRGIIPSCNLGVIFFLEKKIKQEDFHKMQGEHTYLSYSGKLTAFKWKKDIWHAIPPKPAAGCWNPLTGTFLRQYFSIMH